MIEVPIRALGDEPLQVGKQKEAVLNVPSAEIDRIAIVANIPKGGDDGEAMAELWVRVSFDGGRTWGMLHTGYTLGADGENVTVQMLPAEFGRQRFIRVGYNLLKEGDLGLRVQFHTPPPKPAKVADEEVANV